MSTAKDAFEDIFSGNSMGPAFTSYNNLRQQMGAYHDWVYAAASRVAEECSCIDIELYINRTKQKNATVGRRLANNRARMRKYFNTRVIDIYVKDGRIHTKANAPALEEVDDSPLAELLDHPNNFMSGVEFLEMTFLHLELTGNSFWAIIRGPNKTPVEMWPLMPNQMRIVPDETEFIKGYVYTANGQQIPFAPEDIIHHKYSNPSDLRWGMSTVQASARAIDTDSMAADYNRKFFYNSAQPDAVLYTDKYLDEKTWLRIKDQFQNMYGGTANAHKTAVLENGLKYQAMNPNQREMEFLKSREFNRDMILAMFGVPKSVLGMDASMSRANAETAEYVFAKGTIRPKMLRLTAGIQEKLAPQFDKRLVVSFADPVPEDKDFKRQERKELANLVITVNEAREDMGLDPVAGGDKLYINANMVSIGAKTQAPISEPVPLEEPAAGEEEEIHAGNDTGEAVVEPKSMHSKAPLPVPEGHERCTCCEGYGEHYVTGFECYRCDAGGSVDKTEAKQPVPCGGREDSAEVWIDEDGHYRHSEEKGLKTTITATDKTAATKLLHALAPTPKKKEVSAKAVDYEDSRNEVADKYEPKMFKAILAHMKEQEAEVLANVDKRFKSLQKAQGKRVIKANLDDLFDPKKSEEGWQARLGIIFQDIITAMGIISVANLEEESGIELPPYDPSDPSVKKFYTDSIRRISVYFDEETQKQLGATLMEGVDAGESVDELRKRVKTVYKASQEGDLMFYRAERVARTEPIFATTWSTLDSWKKSGVVIGKEWRTAGQDDLLCIYCGNMDGQTFMNDLDGAWYEVGDSLTVADSTGKDQTMKFSYVDVIGPPLHPNCRCTLLPIMK